MIWSSSYGFHRRNYFARDCSRYDLFGKARKGEALPILRVWIVGQAFEMSAITIGIFGIAAIIVSRPL
jgi:hypothetical protein